MSDRLHMLLVAIREGVASEEAVAEARDLLSGDARVPDELKEDALTERAERAARRRAALRAAAARGVRRSARRRFCARRGLEEAARPRPPR